MSKDDTTIGLEPNLAGLLCYVPCCIGLIASVVVAIMEKKSRFVRFHAFQSLLLHGVAVALSVAIQIVTMVMGMMAPIIGGMLGFALSGVCLIALLGASIFLMMKAHANEEYRLPTLGDMAAKWM
jgi:uncharacterized membrane protein